MSSLKAATLGVAAVIAVAGAIAAVALLKGAAPGEAPKTRAQRSGNPLHDMRDLVGGTPRIIRCRERERDQFCRIEGPTGLRADCALPKDDLAGRGVCWRFDTPNADARMRPQRKTGE